MEEKEKRRIRKGPLILLFLAVALINLIPLGFGPPSYITMGAGVNFHSTTTGGPISFSDSFTTTQVYWSGGLVYFNGFDNGPSFNLLGFSSSDDLSLQYTTLSKSEMLISATLAGPTGTAKIYVDNLGSPYSVDGVDSWSYASNIVTMSLTSSSNIDLNWGGIVPSVVEDDLKETYLEVMDFTGFIISNYTELLGRGFYALIGLVIVTAAYMRAGPGAALIVALLGWGIFIASIPSNAVAIMMIIMSLAGGLLIAWFFLSRRGST